jgi:TP901 family phage tail tape measure protein
MISAPLGLFLKQQAGMAIEFENALKRVQKVTSFTTEEMASFKDGIRDLATNSATSHTELLKVAEVLGQMGVTSGPAIVDLTRIFNMFATSTDMAADTAATALGRISNAFRWNLNESSVEVEKLANVLNKLENTNAATAKQVVTGMSKWAQQAEQMNINAAQASALTTTLIAMGFSEGEAGTALNRLTMGLVKNRDAVAAAMSQWEGYGSEMQVVDRINEDAVQVILDIADAAAAGSNEALALATMLEIGGVRGGRAMAAFASAASASGEEVNILRQNLAIANQEWEEAGSLAAEYELAMSSTASEMALLRNNINDVGITIGDAMLPTINQLIEILVPALRLFNEWFKSMDDGTKRMIILGAVGVVALGPALFMFGQLANAVSLVILGFGRLILLVPQALGAVAGLVKPILMVGKAFLSWPGMVLVAVVGIMKVLANAGVDIAGFFVDLGNRAKAWGENLAATYANGFISGAVRYISAAIQWVANMIASFFQGHSPPDKGPLSTIDKWGAAVMEAYLKGFGQADFSILSNVGKTIQQWLTRGLQGEELADALEKVAGARFNLSELISKFNKTGVIDSGMLKNITAGLGPIADNVRDLIRNWLKYNEIQERIAAIEERRKQVKRTYLDELKAIAGGTAGIKDKVAAIREAQRARDDNLRGLNAEQEALEEQGEEHKKNMDYQKALIDAMQEQEDIFQRIADALKQVTEALAEAMTEPTGFGGGMTDPELPNVDELFDDALEDFKTLNERLTEGKGILQGFIDAWQGNANIYDGLDSLPDDLVAKMGLDSEQVDLYDTLYNIGERAREIYDTLVTWKDAAVAFGISVKEAWDGIDFDNIIDFDSIFDIDIDLSFFDNIKDAFSRAFGDTGSGKNPLDYLVESFDTVKEAWADFKDAFFGEDFEFSLANIDWEALGTKIGNFFGNIAKGAVIIAGVVLRVIAFLIMIPTWIKQLQNNLNDLQAKIEEFKTSIGDAIAGWWTHFIERSAEGIAEFSAAWNSWWEQLVEDVKAWFWQLYYDLIGGSIIPDMFAEIITALTGFVTDFLASVLTWVTDTVEDATELKDKVVEQLVELVTLALAEWETLKTNAEEKWEAIRSAVETKAEELKQNVIDKITSIGTWIQEQAQVFITFGVNIVEGLIQGIESMGDSLKGALLKIVNDAISRIKKFLGIESPSTLTMQFGEWTGEGFVRGVLKTENDVSNALLSAIGGPVMSTGAIAGAGAGGFGGGTTQVTLDLRESRIGSDDDIDRLVDKVVLELGKMTNNKIKYGGRVKF